MRVAETSAVRIRSIHSEPGRGAIEKLLRLSRVVHGNESLDPIHFAGFGLRSRIRHGRDSRFWGSGGDFFKPHSKVIPRGTTCQVGVRHSDGIPRVSTP